MPDRQLFYFFQTVAYLRGKNLAQRARALIAIGLGAGSGIVLIAFVCTVLVIICTEILVPKREKPVELITRLTSMPNVQL